MDAVAKRHNRIDTKSHSLEIEEPVLNFNVSLKKLFFEYFGVLDCIIKEIRSNWNLSSLTRCTIAGVMTTRSEKFKLQIIFEKVLDILRAGVICIILL